MDIDYRLRWPADLFVDEVDRLLGTLSGGFAEWRSLSGGRDAELLLEEAFESPVPLADYKKACEADQRHGPDEVVEYLESKLFLRKLREHADDLAAPVAWVPLWSQRDANQNSSPSPADERSTRRQFCLLVGELLAAGYFDHHWHRPCLDDLDGVEPEPNRELDLLTGLEGLWPVDASRDRWSTDCFLDLIEIFHDVVARPTSRRFHTFEGCGWHWDDYVPSQGKRLYRHRVNQILAASDLHIELVDIGDGHGRLRRRIDDDRESLLDSAATHEEDRVQHAVKLFRSRDADRNKTRTAVVELATALEPLRVRLRGSVGRAGESQLFEIANRFALRHQGDDQLDSYSENYLEWVFWWYLATIDLMRKELGEEDTAGVHG